MDYEILVKDQPDRATNMAIFSVVVDSGGYGILARVYKPALDREDEKRPTLILAHGFPGNDQFPDLAQALRRAGFVCITYTARGAWGSYGPYRFDTLLDDAQAVLKYVRENAAVLSVDVDNIFYFGHSVGGLNAVRFLASGPDVAGAVIVTPCDMPEVHDNYRELFDTLAANAAPLLRFGEGEDVSVLYDELAEKGAEWKFPILGRQVDPRYPVLVIGGGRDTICPISVHIEPLLAAFDEAGVKYDYIEIDADHNLQNKRIEFTRVIYKWLLEHNRNLNGAM